MGALETLFNRRSIRHYTEKPISQIAPDMMLNAAMNVPSAVNKQPWHFIVL
jgi:nitroreductase